MTNNLKNLLLKYLQENEGWHRKVSLFVLGDEWGFSPESIGRKLRELESEGKIFVEYYDGKFSKNLAQYSTKKREQKKVVEINGKIYIYNDCKT